MKGTRPERMEGTRGVSVPAAALTEMRELGNKLLVRQHIDEFDAVLGAQRRVVIGGGGSRHGEANGSDPKAGSERSIAEYS